MTDKKAFGSFVRIKRTEKNYSQKDLAELLFVTEGAVSKWERGVSYPDITLIADICRVLDISEHELITASTDEDSRKIKLEAGKYRLIRNTWFWVPTIAYTVTLLICFICNLAVSGTLSWFFIVLAALVCAYTFVPTVTCFFPAGKLLAFCISTYLSVCLLMLTCAFYNKALSWLPTACIGLLMGYVLLFVPILLSNGKYSRYKFFISFTVTCALTVVLMLYVNALHPFMLAPSVLITLYAFLPPILCSIVGLLRFDAFLKTGICIGTCTVFYYFTDYVAGILFGTSEDPYQVNFHDWIQCLEGNIYLIFLITFLIMSFVFIGIGFLRIYKRKKRSL